MTAKPTKHFYIIQFIDVVMKKGDFVLVDFVGRIEATGEIFDCTIEEEAKGHAFIEGHKYEPAPVIIGAGMIIRGVENRLEAMDVGGEARFIIQPEEGFGPRVREMVRVISLTQFTRQRITVVPGIYVRIDGMQAKIQTVSGGRVRVDFNDPLAGKRLDYTVRIVRKVESADEKLRLLMKHYRIESETTYDPSTKECKVITDKKLLNILEKVVRGIVSNWIPEVAKVEFVVKSVDKDAVQTTETALSAQTETAPSAQEPGKAVPATQENKENVVSAQETVSQH